MGATSYGDYLPPRTPWQWVRMTGSQWRTRFSAWRRRGDGRDYTGWRVRVVRADADGLLPPVDVEGLVVWGQRSGAARLHQIDFGDRHPGVALALPARHLHLFAPTRE